jgi:ferredoxin
VDALKCLGCGACVPACRFDAIHPRRTVSGTRSLATSASAAAPARAAVPPAPSFPGDPRGRALRLGHSPGHKPRPRRAHPGRGHKRKTGRQSPRTR